jgi:hypothetical protein
VTYIFYGPSGILEGTYTLSVEATDRGGLKTIESVTTILDRTSPAVTISTPLQNQEMKEKHVTVSWSMLDSGSGIASVRVSVDGSPFVTIGQVTSYLASNLADGDHKITVRVTDRAGNVMEKSVNFTVSTGGGMSTLTLAAIALSIIAVVVVAALVIKRRKGPGTKEKKT